MGILVIEDEPLVALDLKSELCNLGFDDVYLASDLSTGSSLLRSKMFGLGILDVNIGRRLVFPFAAELRARRIPIVFFTSLLRGAFPTEWATHPIVPKPWTRNALINSLSSVGFHLSGRR